MTDFVFCLIIFAKINIVFYRDKNLITYTILFLRIISSYHFKFIYQIYQIWINNSLFEKSNFKMSNNIFDPSSFLRRERERKRKPRQNHEATRIRDEFIFEIRPASCPSMFPRFFRGNTRFMTRTCYHKRPPRSEGRGSRGNSECAGLHKYFR